MVLGIEREVSPMDGERESGVLKGFEREREGWLLSVGGGFG